MEGALGRGMGRKKAENCKDKYFKFRATKEEIDFMRAIAKSEGITMTDVMREGLGLAKRQRALDGRLDAALKTLE